MLLQFMDALCLYQLHWSLQSFSCLQKCSEMFDGILIHRQCYDSCPWRGGEWEQRWGSLDRVIKSRLRLEEGIDMEIMKNKLETLEFFILHLISSLNVYVMSCFCLSRFTHMKTEA